GRLAHARRGRRRRAVRRQRTLREAGRVRALRSGAGCDAIGAARAAALRRDAWRRREVRGQGAQLRRAGEGAAARPVAGALQSAEPARCHPRVHRRLSRRSSPGRAAGARARGLAARPVDLRAEIARRSAAGVGFQVHARRQRPAQGHPDVPRRRRRGLLPDAHAGARRALASAHAGAEAEGTAPAAFLPGSTARLPARRDHRQEEARLRCALRRLAAHARAPASDGRRRVALAGRARRGAPRVSRRAARASALGACGLLRDDGLGADGARALAACVAAGRRARGAFVILRTLTALASPAGARSRLSAFYFHRTLERPDPLLPGEPDARMFDSILQWIGSQFRVLDPLEACERLYDGSLPSRAAIISFDDGYRDNYTVALPLLLRRRMPAVFFVATGFLGDGAMFNDRVIEAVRRCPDSSLRAPAAGGDGEAVYPIGSDAERRTAIHRILAAIKHLHPEEREERVRRLEREAGVVPRSDLMMDASQVAALHHAGMHVGGHTRSHPILRALPDAQAEAEIRGGADDLAAIVGQRPALFAYPNGRHGKDF